MSKLVKKEHVTLLEWIFKISYLLLGLATFNTFLYSSPVQPILVKICLVFGIISLLGRILFFRDYIKAPFWILLTLFCISFLVTIFANRSLGGAVADFKWLIWTGMLFFMLYVCDSTRSRESYKKEFSVLAHIVTIYSALAAIVGVCMMLSLYYKTWYTGDGERMLAGFHWGRLWGIYTDPNYGAVFSVTAILLCVYFMKRVKGWRKICYIIAVIANFFYITFSDSRTAEVCMVLAVTFWVLYIAAVKFNMRKGFVIGVLISIAFSAAFIGSTTFIKSQCNETVQKKIYQKMKKNGEKLSVSKRKSDIQKDVSSGRFELWESGVEIWKTSPILGTGYNSFLPYVKKNLPTTYVVNNKQGNYVSLHNTYLNILAYQGILGAAIFLTFMLLILKRWWQGICSAEPQDRDYIAVLTACIIVIAVSMMFILEGIYTNSPGSFMLWTFLGYLMHYMTTGKKVENQG